MRIDGGTWGLAVAVLVVAASTLASVPAVAQSGTLQSGAVQLQRPGQVAPRAPASQPSVPRASDFAPVSGGKAGPAAPQSTSGNAAERHTALLNTALTAIEQSRAADAVQPVAESLRLAEQARQPSWLAQSYYVSSAMNDGLGNYPASEADARRALAAVPDGPLAGAIHDMIGNALYEQGRFDEAMEAFRQALLVHEASDTPSEQSNSLMMMAVVRGEQRLFPEGEALYRRAMAVATAAGQTDTANVIASNLAWNLHEQGRYDEADPMLRRAVIDLTALDGPVSRNAAASRTNLAGNLQAQGRDAEALPLFRQALSIFEQTVGRQHSQAGWTLNHMARSIEVVEGAAAAEPFYREAVALSAARLPPGHPEATGMIEDLARHLVRNDRPREALPLLRDAGTALRARSAQASGSTQVAREFDRFRSVYRLEVEAAWLSAGTR